MPDSADKIREQRLRRTAARLDWGVHKSRTDGTFYVWDTWTNTIVAPASISYGGEYGFSLDEAEEFIQERSRQAALR